MIQNTDNKPLSELYSSDHKVTYHIPKYQREYIWSKPNWEALFEDIEESNGGHFLGSIICINTQKDSHKPAELELVDGQQRMTTISLFYLALYKYLNDKLPVDASVDDKMDIWSLKNRVIIKDKKEIRLFPSYSNQNLEDYKFIFSEVISDFRKLSRPKNLGNRRMLKAFNYFFDRLNELDEDDNTKYTYGDVKKILDKLNSASLVKIDVNTHSDAFILFETLNNRGVPLSAIDLIKNKLLGQLEKIDPKANLDENFKRWDKIIKNLTDDYTVQERFLRQFYNAFNQESDIKVDKKPKALRSNLISIYETLINSNVNSIFDKLEEASEIYSKHIQYDNDEHSKELVIALRNLENVNSADSYMLLLFLVKKFKITESDKIRLINLLCNYSIRRNVTDSPPTRDLTNYFMDIISEANKLSTYSYEVIRDILIQYGKPSSDEYFRIKLSGDLYEENVGATRFILSSIETAATQTREKYTNFYSRNKKIFVWTIEHVFPQGDNIPDEWVNMVADGDKEKAQQIKKDWVHKLGNLTLTGYNSQLSNMSLEKKQNKTDKEGKCIGFKNGLYLNSELATTPSWNKDKIKKRTELLVSKALEVFKI